MGVVMRNRLLALCVLALIPPAAWSQQLIVFPVVSDEVPGEYDSLWVTVVRVVKKNPFGDVTVRRKWVCLPGGGYVDNSAEAPSWDLSGTGTDDRLFFARGRRLLAGTGSQLGAVALEVEGGDVLAHAYVADVTRGSPLYPDHTFGLGQLIPAQREPLVGPSHIPWLPGCIIRTCETYGDDWEFMRDNIGILNPNPEPMTITGDVLVFDANPPTELGPFTHAFVRELEPYEWVQFHWHPTQVDYGSDHYGVPYEPSGGFVLSLTPDKDLPYYAYASVVFSPDPLSGVPMFSDPMFIPAEPEGFAYPQGPVEVEEKLF
jgi:hypothetical protein